MLSAMKLIRNIVAAFRLKKAFTLVELSVVLMVSGLLVAAGLQGAQMMSEQAKIDDTKKKLDEIETALISFAKLYQRIPCPARRDIAPGGSYVVSSVTYPFGTEDCDLTASSASISDSLTTVSSDTVRVGVVPVATLNLPTEYMFDGYGNRITYAMVKGLGTAGTGTGEFSGFTTTRTDGILKIHDSSGNQITYPSIKSVVAYVLVSHGKDGKGAFSRSGSQISGCSGSTGDNMNCDDAPGTAHSATCSSIPCSDDATFRDAPIFDVAGNAAYYDDYIRWKTLDRLKTQANLTTVANLPTCTDGQCLVYSTTTSTWGCGTCGSGGGGGGQPNGVQVGSSTVYTGTYGTPSTNVANITIPSGAAYMTIAYWCSAYTSYPYAAIIKFNYKNSGNSIVMAPDGASFTGIPLQGVYNVSPAPEAFDGSFSVCQAGSYYRPTWIGGGDWYSNVDAQRGTGVYALPTNASKVALTASMNVYGMVKYEVRFWGASSSSGGSSSGMPSCTVAGQQPVFDGSGWVCTPTTATTGASCTNVGALAIDATGGAGDDNLLVCKEGTTPIEDAPCDAVGIGMISYEIDGSQYVCKNQ